MIFTGAGANTPPPYWFEWWLSYALWWYIHANYHTNVNKYVHNDTKDIYTRVILTKQQIMASDRNVIVVSLYPMKRTQQVWRSRTKLWNDLNRKFNKIVLINADPSQDDGYKELKQLKNYQSFSSRLVDNEILNVICTTVGESNIMYSIRVFPLL